ncbi:unnamed protein product [Zymoseptoria tritici ST99CH_3D1]|uniref:Inositol polyphosphate-related phosphatase domain-containing protein n=2 Tax=Zymoseptoria tritici TaxID=1047171 RepID=A0A1X7S142_ZYMT9|nr:unnamed protein product [Zymoseptoria tritici ST99CH_3D7]SMR59845.1 unnamed protein product [Zymoseptoria tritici ST99CH_3D1]
MEEKEEGPDTTSIKPISSLRTKFEQLAKTPDAGQSSPVTTPKPPHLNASQNITGGRSKGSEVGQNAGTGQRAASVQLAQKLTPRQHNGSPPKARPASMVVTSPTMPTAPAFALHPPRSPHKTMSVDIRSGTSGSPLRDFPSPRNGDGPNAVHTRHASRTATPALEARISAFLRPTETASSFPEDLTVDTKSRSDAGPPAINRAGKPQIPIKPPVLKNKSSTLIAPEPKSEATAHRASPFNTPPSSGEASPVKKDFRPQGQVDRVRAESNASVVQRKRNDSDASWVQRIRGDSDASFASHTRSDSNASFVEPSSLEEASNGSSTEPRDLPVYVQSRRSTMPAKYHPSRTSAPQDDLLEDRPRLPARPELQMRLARSPPKAQSGRSSPAKVQALPPKRSMDGLARARAKAAQQTPVRIPATKPAQRSALEQGFGVNSPLSTSARALPAPAIPAPRRSVDRRREMPPPPPPPATVGHSRDDEEDNGVPELNSELVAGPTDFPDATQANRRAPKFKQRPWQIPTEYDTRLFAVCGDYVCTTGYYTRVWSVRSGELLVNEEHREGLKMTAVAFKPSPNIEDEGKRIWLGTNTGEIHELDLVSQKVVRSKIAHRREVIRIFRYASELWTLDEGGELYVWMPDHGGMPSLDSQYTNWKVPKGHTFSIATGKQLWYATGKNIRVFRPSARSDTEFHMIINPLSQPGTGDVTSGACLDSKPDLVYFGHSDGKVTIYSRTDFSCRAVVNVSVYRISCLAGVGDYLWAGYSTGMTYIYDTSTNPWSVKKDWPAHDKQVCGIIADPTSMWKAGRLNVITMGQDNLLRIWDGMLESDWIESRMQAREPEHCTFRELSVAVLTWNAGASKPSHLQHSMDDQNFFYDYLRAQNSPDILVFGFQELVDLEDKKQTAKSFFKSKRKDPAEQEHMSHQYRAWRDHLTRCLAEHMPDAQSYQLVHSASMVGLFTCVFVKSAERSRIRHIHTAEIKRGMGGLHGNKGAIIMRLVLDDSSLCFVNCHLAAGQTQTLHRNNDVTAILEANALPSYPLEQASGAQHSDVFTAGGDGSMILDHEICILNGDLNYRIDTMGRDTVVKHVQQGNLSRLLERDQLLLSRRKNPGFRLRAFQESPINFAPTYKYNVRTDDYDTSEKRRSPAWCDRILYRGIGKIKMEEYRRWDQLRVSDHRPVSGRLLLRVKTVDPDKREIIWDKCLKDFDGVRQRIARAAQLEYLTNVLGLSHREAAAALKT